MATCSLLDIPDLALYKICTFVSCPFDLLHFGNTCSRLRKISSAPSLWQALSFRWLRGLWVQLEEGSVEETPREWFLDIIAQCSKKSTCTKQECVFERNERWVRVDSRKFRFLFNLLLYAYAMERDEHPAVLFERYLYDIGLYVRVNPQLNFDGPQLNLCKHTITELTNLSQAAERDLGRRKQPHKDLKYYIHRIQTTQRELLTNLFPCGATGSICPLLMFPYPGRGRSSDASGLPGVAACLSLIFEHHLQTRHKGRPVKMRTIWEVIKVFCTVFVSEFVVLSSPLDMKLGTKSLGIVILSILEENSHIYNKLQSVLDHFSIHVSCRDILMDLHAQLKEHSGIDFAIEDVRKQLRLKIIEMIDEVLFPPYATSDVVTRYNLTDSDIVGGDNHQQEMACAAIISKQAVLVTWHLVGRQRY